MFSPDEFVVASASRDKAVKLCDMLSVSQQQTLMVNRFKDAELLAFSNF